MLKPTQEVKSMKIEPVDENTLLFSCKYSCFDIDLIVTNEEVQLLIDSPSKYDGTKENAELEKKKKKKINQNYNVSKELFIDYLLNIINESADLIDEFIANNNPDLLINGRTINKLCISIENSCNIRPGYLGNSTKSCPVIFFHKAWSRKLLT